MAIIYPANTAKMPMLIQDPHALLDHTMDWSDWLDALNDTLSGATWTVPEGLTKEAETNTATHASVFLSGGVVNTTYTVTCHITTAAGRQDERSFKLKIVER